MIAKTLKNNENRSFGVTMYWSLISDMCPDNPINFGGKNDDKRQFVSSLRSDQVFSLTWSISVYFLIIST